MSNRRMGVFGWIAVACLALAAPAVADHHEAQEKGAKQGGPSPEQRAKMADAHQRMAECLRSTRPINECRSEMQSACRSAGGGNECSMGHHGHGRGKGPGAGAAAGTTDATTSNGKAKGKSKGQAGTTTPE